MNWSLIFWIGIGCWVFIIFLSVVVPRFFPAIQCKIYDLVSKLRRKK